MRVPEVGAQHAKMAGEGVMPDFASMSRAELRAYLRANDPQPQHWLKRANRLLEARLEANRVAQGWPAVRMGVPAETQELPEFMERFELPAVERVLGGGSFGGVALP
jgi:hypothetical protein